MKNIKISGRSLRIITPLVFIYFFSINYALSQDIPPSLETGVVEKELERRPLPKRPEKEIPVIRFEKPKEELLLPEGIKVFVKEIKITGNTVIPTSHLHKLLAPYEGKELSIKELREAAGEITKEYQRRGYFLSYAYLPVQEIKEGVLEIAVVEVKLGEVKIRGNNYYTKKYIKDNFRPTRNGLVHYQRLIKSLLLLNENMDCRVNVTFVRGTQPGRTDVILTVTDKWPFHMYYDFNNFGSRYISKRRHGLALDYGNFIRSGDRLALRGIIGDPFNRLKYGSAEYRLPINGYGTKLGFSYSHLEFDAIREFKVLGISGESKIYSAEIRHPVIRNRLSNLDLALGLDYKQVYNFLLAEVDSNDQLRILRLNLDYDHIDGFQGHNYIRGKVSFGMGEVMGALRKDDVWSSRMGADNNFTKVNLTFIRLQRMPFSSFLILRAQGQYASDDLAVVEEFAIGGADSVRGYPQSEYLGDQGYNVSLELRTPPPLLGNVKFPFLNKKIKEVIQIVGFIDNAGVYYKHYLVGERRSHRLTGAGAGILLTLPGDTNLRIDVGFPIGETEPSDGANTHLYIQFSKKIF